jgi:hypothetical protein
MLNYSLIDWKFIVLDKPTKRRSVSFFLVYIFAYIGTEKRMPARLILQSPWFSQIQNICHQDDAIQRMSTHFESNVFI